MAGGRPSKYTDEIADYICEQTATTEKSLKTICSELDLGVRTVLDWLRDNNKFSHMYARAKEAQADLLAEQILAIADDTSNDTIVDAEGNERQNNEWINRSRLRVDARKWIAAKLKPKVYGDKIQQDVNVTGLTSRIIKNRNAGNGTDN